MSFFWPEYLDLANELKDAACGTSLDEARLRCALSRAYYAAFCTSRNLLKKTDTRIDDRISHTDVRHKFRERGHKGRWIAQQLDDMYLRRVKADYRDTHSTLQNDTEYVLESARKVIASIDNWDVPQYRA